MQKKVLATITIPYTNPKDTTTFAAIHSNPPGIKTDMPSVVTGKYGKGKVIWSAASFEKNPQKAHKDVFINMVRELYGNEPVIGTNAPGFVEFTVFKDDEDNCLLLNCINVQEYMPMIKTGGFNIKLKVDKEIIEVKLLPDCEKVEFVYNDGYVEFTVENLEIFKMYVLSIK